MTRRDQRSAEAEAWRRWYRTARWQRLRASHLRSEPLCRSCKAKGRITLATVCDHVTPHKGDPDRFWHGPFQSLCTECHNRTKQREERRGHHDEVDASGWPTDERHRANRHRAG